MKIALIAGNGPSIKNIDYSRLPREYDVFRTNQFYFEDKYYLGKEIKFAFANPGLFLEQYFTLNNLIYKNEYHISNILCATFNLDHMVDQNLLNKAKDYFPNSEFGYEYLKKLKKFHTFIKFNEIYNNRRITSGIYMCAVAVAMGYDEIYLTGIDFYDSSLDEYAFNHKKINLSNLAPAFNDFNSKYNRHSKEMDIEALYFLQNEYNIKLYSLNCGSILSQYIDVAPICGNSFTPLDKNKNYINDILIPDKCAYHYAILANLKNTKQYSIKNNLWFRLIKDLVRLPSDIKHYLKDKR
ncbi:alpha-2,3 sialyltransferase [Campylobacter insulaenigrae]|uniref:Alpha-2,3 sialyltransferase n=1 Tax=Campylobacter insulaenigrae TaxID=260714 RepID=A0ABY3G504_9BACT|nr:alpha-2,3-sialyltransferase [Campylobacter insulaenigrae]MCR6591459.1 alpha-2,3-sialyltransferase [Campylobacter insulaenigrae]MCR6592940.1 alpha-2,3-sialyltransferase [Campylobacter insulaenigrae]TWO27226.1 alpha-2,3 sialyltransferase [Campylobacter insulaenigrae]VEJ54963.1 alpha-2,3 sialyltransferase [Campylobacter insulaenigrae]